MKRKFLFSLALVCLSLSVFAQKSETKPTKFDARIGIGLFPTFLKDDAQVNILPINANLDYRLSKLFSLGIYAGYSKSTASKQGVFGGDDMLEWSNQFLTVGVRGTFHFPTSFKNWEPYGGVTIGANTSMIEVKQGVPETIEKMQLKTNTDFAMTFFVGTRFKVSENIGVYGEIGFMASLANVGISYRF